MKWVIGLGCTLAVITFCAAASAASARPTLITETFYGSATPYPNDRGYYNNDAAFKTQAGLWNKLLLDMGIENPAPPNESWQAHCHYDLAIKTLQNIRHALGADTPYQKIWAQNQDRVFSACDTRKSTSTPPLAPQGKALPKRVASDFLYQQASWNFYRSDLDAAYTLYSKLAGMRDAPMRPYAAYMMLRTLRAQHKEEEAYQKIDGMLADPSLKAAHPLIANYRFIMGWYGSGPAPEKHLQWLLGMIRISPDKSADIKQSYADYLDAMDQLNAYFPYYDTSSKTVDWWLTDVPLDSQRMKAVRKLAPKNEIVDWMQAKWAYNIFDTDWLWALHQPENAYWKQNQNIVLHAWKRWQHGDGLEWLQIAAKRVRPSDPLAGDILKASQPYLDQDWKSQTKEYQAWLLDIWTHAVRLHLGREEYAQAIALIEAHANFKDLGNKSYATSPTAEYLATLNNTMRWLVYTGHIAEGRNALVVILTQLPHSFQQWRTLLATSKEELIAANQTQMANWYELQNSPNLWRAMVDSFSTESLYALANDTTLMPDERAFMARAAITRAILLGASDEEIDQYAILAAKLNPSIREPLLKAVARHKFNDYVAFLLRTPRMRPLPYLEYIVPSNFSYQSDSNALNADLTQIDTVNHSDNNWWCRVNGAHIDDRLFEVARIVPDARRHWEYRHIAAFFDVALVDKETAPYLEKQRALLAQHPYHQLVDTQELKALEAISSGPEYLSKAATKQAKGGTFSLWGNDKDADTIAANLYSAVRTTRYGCERDGSHLSYSHEAYETLHQKYGDSTWAKATPYWFGCAHFRNGCPQAATPSP